MQILKADSQLQAPALPTFKNRPASTRGTFAGLAILAGRAVLLSVLLIAPWVFGGAEYRAQVWLYSGVLVSLGFLVVALIAEPTAAGHSALLVPTLLIPVVAALLLGAVQISPDFRPQIAGWERFSSAPSQELQTGGPSGRLSPAVAQELAQRSRVSLYPASTRIELARLTAGAAAFVAGFGLFATTRSQLVLWFVLALNGTALTIFGLVQKLTWNQKLFWTVPLTIGGQPFASYVNRNNAAGYLNLCLGAAVALAIYLFAKTSSPLRRGQLYGPRRRAAPNWIATLLRLETSHVVAVTVCIVILAGSLCSLSRGGAAAALIGVVVFAGLLGWRQRSIVAPLAVGAALAVSVGLMSWTGLSGSFSGRFASLFDDGISTDSRWINWQAAGRAALDFPVLGTGLGSYRYACQPYQAGWAESWFYNADNQYVEALTEGGLIGIVLVLVCCLLVLRAAWSLIRADHELAVRPVAFAAAIVMSTQLLQATTDFGLTLPANLITFAVICGVVIGAAARCYPAGSAPWTLVLPMANPRWVMCLVALGLLLNGSIGVREVQAAAQARSARGGIPVLDRSDALEPQQVEELLTAMESASHDRKDDAELHEALARLWTYRYRQQLFAALEKHHADSTDPAAPVPNWKSTELSVLHRFANTAFQRADFETVDSLRSLRAIDENLGRARAHLLAAEAACPLLPRVDLQLAQLGFLVDENPGGLASLERAAALNPADPDMLLSAGRLALQAGRSEAAYRFWRQSLAVGGRRQHERLMKIIPEVPFDDLLEHVLPPSPALMLVMARDRNRLAANPEQRDALTAKARLLLESPDVVLSDIERPYWKAVAARLDGRLDEAVTCYQQALARSPDAVNWRMELAETFHDAGNLDEAIREARKCTWMESAPPAAGKLLERLVHQKLTASPQPGGRSAEEK